jgi:hypothetical protein
MGLENGVKYDGRGNSSKDYQGIKRGKKKSVLSIHKGLPREIEGGLSVCVREG